MPIPGSALHITPEAYRRKVLLALKYSKFHQESIPRFNTFHDEMHHTGYPASEYPDVCLGINEETPGKEVVWIKDLFERNGYSVKYNVPFAGSLVPLKYFGDSRVKSVMLEINRRIYCNGADDFQKVQALCEKVYLHLARL